MADKYPHGATTTLSDGRVVSTMETSPGVGTIAIWNAEGTGMYFIDLADLAFRESGRPAIDSVSVSYEDVRDQSGGTRG